MVLASSHFVALPYAISAVSSIDFNIHSIVWDLNNTINNNSHNNPFVDPILSKSKLLENDANISRSRDDSIFL